jgi:hypothetical protein
MTLDGSADRSKTESALTESLRAVVVAARPSPASDGRETKAERDYRELLAAVSYLDASPSRWTEFLGNVAWEFDQGGIDDRTKLLEEALSRDPRTSALPASLLASQLVVSVFEASAENEATLRVLKRATLDEVARASAEDLQAWAEHAQPERLRDWMADVDRHLKELDQTTARHGNELAALRGDGLSEISADLVERYIGWFLSDTQAFRVLGYDQPFGIDLMWPLEAETDRREPFDAILLLESAATRIALVGEGGAGKSTLAPSDRPPRGRGEEDRPPRSPPGGAHLPERRRVAGIISSEVHRRPCSPLGEGGAGDRRRERDPIGGWSRRVCR